MPSKYAEKMRLISLHLPPSLLDMVDEVARELFSGNRSEAIRWLIAYATVAVKCAATKKDTEIEKDLEEKIIRPIR